jgi:SAM-dependent methyltransferase
MPTSSDENKTQVADLLGEIIERIRYQKGGISPRVLDVGAGSGTWAKLLNPAVPGVADSGCRLTAVEYYPDYINNYGLFSLYDEVWRMDARDLTPGIISRFDAVIFGDVLEHMPKHGARNLIAKCQDVPVVLVSNPIVHAEFDGPDGHDLDSHRMENLWTACEMSTALTTFLAPSYSHSTLIGEVLSYHLAIRDHNYSTPASIPGPWVRQPCRDGEA